MPLDVLEHLDPGERLDVIVKRASTFE